MKFKMVSALSLMVAMVLLAGVATADQVTIGPSGMNLKVSDSAGITSVSVTGSGLGGVATYPDTSPFVGFYKFWFGSGSMPSISNVSPFNYDVNMGAAILWLQVCVQTCTGGSNPGQFLAEVTIQSITTFNPKTPQVSGYMTIMSSSGMLAADFPVNSQPIFDVNLTKITPSTGIDYVYTHPGSSITGEISSGEVIPTTPEPGTLVLMGSGLVGLAGIARRKWMR